jgi:hypothetical protein
MTALRSAPRLFLALSAAALLAVAAAGCDSFLEQPPLGEATAANFFQSEGDAIAATNATYSVLRSFNVHVFSWLGMTSIIADEATKGSTPSDASFLLELDDLTFQADNLAFRATWGGYYQGIFRANTAIQEIPNIDMDEALRARLVAENKFLRAYFYFFLVRAFGGVPLLTEPLEPGEFEQPRASADEVWALIERDLMDARGALPEQSALPTSELGRATRGAARGFLAKAHLFQQEYTEAQRFAEEVIDSGEYSLEDDFAFIFTQAGEFSGGSVWEIQNAALETGGGSSQYAQVQGVRGFPNLGWGFNQPSDFLEQQYEPGDPRQQSTILYPWEILPEDPSVVVHVNPNIPNQQYNQKAQPDPDTPRGSGNSTVNIRRLRYADVLLIGAEAAFQNGDEQAARTYLNRVRERARDGRTNTLGIQPETLDETLATENLGLGAGTSRVFVRFVNTDASDLEPLASSFLDGPAIPALIESMDVIEAVGGTPVTTLDEYTDAVDALTPGTTVTLDVLRIEQETAGDGSVSTSSQSLQIDASVAALLPNVTASGQALLDAIWQDRTSELAMEQHRWFDIVRQGRAESIMSEAGKTFVVGKHELFPIPQSEIDLTGGLLDQNPGYN